VAQVVEYLPTKCEALSSNTSTAPTPKKSIHPKLGMAAHNPSYSNRQEDCEFKNNPGKVRPYLKKI
jgi:hypothetical protein